MFIEDKILDISENYSDYLMSLENVVGVGLGYKYINKIDTLEPCLHVLVEKKLNEKNLFKNNLIPKTYMGIKTDVIQSGAFNVYKSKFTLTQKVRPLQGGFSISSHFAGTGTGTIACIVTRKIKDNRSFYILSNNHVLAGTNEVPIGAPILQPGKLNNGSIHNDVVATLSGFVPIKFNNKYESPTNYMDCAIAKLTTRSLISNKIFIAGKIKGVSSPKLNLPVTKVGMTTGISHGKIITIGATTKVNYGKDSFGHSKLGKFKHQITASLFAKPGDSGSLVLNNKNEAVGLFFTGHGNESSDLSTFSDIRSVLNALKVSIYI